MHKDPGATKEVVELVTRLYTFDLGCGHCIESIWTKHYAI